MGPMESDEFLPGPLPESLGLQVRFLREANQLKGVLRQSSILDGTRKENSAEHSWHLALMAQVLRDYTPPGLPQPGPVRPRRTGQDRVAFSMTPAARRSPWRPWIPAAARSSRSCSAVSPISRASAPWSCASVKR